MIEGVVLLNATPYVLAALGCLISVRAGVINISIEGSMLAGALGGVIVSGATQNPYLGLIGALAVGSALSALLALMHLNLKADLILAGLAMNLLAAGATVVVLLAATGSTFDGTSLNSVTLPPVSIPWLADVPVLGALSALSPLTWLAIAAVPVVTWFYYNTRLGLAIRAAGDNPAALVEAGRSPQRYRWTALLLSGAMAGLAGAQLSMFTTSTFVRDMVQGRGFIALGAVYLGLRHPVGTAAAAVAFGAFEAISTILQTRTSYPTELVLALPYVATIVALSLAGLRTRRKAVAVA